MAEKKTEINFEKALKDLEDVVEKLLNDHNVYANYFQNELNW